MIVAGINSQFDGAFEMISGGAAAIIRDGEILGAVAEERVTRRKYSGGYKNSLSALLSSLELDHSDIDFFYISFYGNSIVPKRDIWTYFSH